MTVLPKWVMDIALIVHSWEAILAFLAIIIWHMYNVHLNPSVFPMSKVWLTGKISLHEFRENHPLEYELHLEEQRARTGRRAANYEPVHAVRLPPYHASVPAPADPVHAAHRADCGCCSPSSVPSCCSPAAPRWWPPTSPSSAPPATRWSLHYDTWRQSAHRNVGCEECHVMPGMMNMFKSKLNALRLVKAPRRRRCRRRSPSRATCRTRTASAATPRPRNWSPTTGSRSPTRPTGTMGVKCTFCHEPRRARAEVALHRRDLEGEGAERQHCLQVHPDDGDVLQVPRRQARAERVLHLPRQPRRAQADRLRPGLGGGPSGGGAPQRARRTAQRCHQTTSARTATAPPTPTPTDWVARHPEEARKDPDGCPTCHLAPAEQQAHRRRGRWPSAPPAMACGRSTSRPTGSRFMARNRWPIRPPVSAATPRAGARPATPSRKPHPPEWLARHSAEATRDPKNCETCHTQQFCNSCHQSKQSVPTSHHARLAGPPQGLRAEPGAGCSTCHTATSVRSCHAQKPPASHGSMWLSQHGVISQVQGDVLHLCHAQSFCNKCHGLIMPHPKDWVKSASARPRPTSGPCAPSATQAKAAAPATTARCPASHKPSHVDGAARRARRRSPTPSVRICHRTDFCNSCHGTEHAAPQGLEDDAPSARRPRTTRDACLRCHREAECTKCHGLPMPHPDNWARAPREAGRGDARRSARSATASAAQRVYDLPFRPCALPATSKRLEEPTATRWPAPRIWICAPCVTGRMHVIPATQRKRGKSKWEDARCARTSTDTAHPAGHPGGDGPSALRPSLVSWNITRQCNLTCAHCYRDACRAPGPGGTDHGAGPGS